MVQNPSYLHGKATKNNDGDVIVGQVGACDDRANPVEDIGGILGGIDNVCDVLEGFDRAVIEVQDAVAATDKRVTGF